MTAAGGDGAGWAVPSPGVGAATGVVVVFAFVVVHDAVIVDIWFNVGPMLAAGALAGSCLTWSYRAGVARHGTAAWFRHGGLYVVEMIVLGVASLVMLRPRFTVAELVESPDAFEQLIGPSLPLIVGATAVGTIVVWAYFGRRRRALVPVLVTQVVMVFSLGHQFAFLGLVESEFALFVTAAGFVVITGGLAAAFCVGVMASTMALGRLRHRARSLR